MARKKVGMDTQAEVLLRSRRRCCICFGLNRETHLKPGQIAHLDKNSSNDNLDNLAFLCLFHHGEYDSTSSQRKNFIAAEVKQYRLELIAALDQTWCAPVTFGEAATADQIVGQYIRINQDSIGAELLVSPLLDGRYHVHGMAVRGPNFHNGEIDFAGIVKDNVLVQEERFDHVQHWEPYNLRIEFSTANQLALVADNHSPMFGVCVRFDGTYIKAGGFGRYDRMFLESGCAEPEEDNISDGVSVEVSGDDR
jgi:hypothetical protein